MIIPAFAVFHKNPKSYNLVDFVPSTVEKHVPPGLGVRMGPQRQGKVGDPIDRRWNSSTVLSRDVLR